MMGDVEAVLASIEPPARRDEARTLAAIMQRVSGEAPEAGSGGIIGFGRYRYRYASGREGNAARIGFAARKSALTLYLTDGYDLPADMVAAIGPSKPGAGCLYLSSLGKVDLAALEALLEEAWAERRRRYPD